MPYFKQLSAESKGIADDFPLFVRHMKQQDNCAAHNHDFVELCIILTGSGEHCTRDTVYPIEAGDIIVIPRGEVHRFKNCSSDLSLTNLLYLPEKLQLPLLDAGLHAGFAPLYYGKYTENGKIPFFHISGAIWNNVRFLEARIREENFNHYPGYRFNMLGTFMMLLSELSRCYIPVADSSSESLRNISQTIYHINNNYKKNINTSKLCKISKMCKSSLMEYFKNATGTTPLQYQLHLRISQAALLLNDDKLNVSEIALQCGFTDSNYFSRQFKRITGLTPSEYRKKQHLNL